MRLDSIAAADPGLPGRNGAARLAPTPSPDEPADVFFPRREPRPSEGEEEEEAEEEEEEVDATRISYEKYEEEEEEEESQAIARARRSRSADAPRRAFSLGTNDPGHAGGDSAGAAVRGAEAGRGSGGGGREARPASRDPGRSSAAPGRGRGARDRRGARGERSYRRDRDGGARSRARGKFQWARHMTCDRLPDPGSLSDANTFLFLWSSKEEEEASMDTAEEKFRLVTNLLSQIERLGRSAASREEAAEREAIAGQLRVGLERWLDLACYRLLRDIEANMIRVDGKTAWHASAGRETVCCVWAPIGLPVPSKRHGIDRDRPSLIAHRKPIELEFEEIRLRAKLPGDLDTHRRAVRALWLAVDHYSIRARSSRMPRLPDGSADLWDPSLDLLRFVEREREEKLRIREEQAEDRAKRLEEKKAILERMENPPVPPKPERKKKRGKKAAAGPSPFEATTEAMFPPAAELLPYLPTPTEIVHRREEEARLETRRALFARCESTELNLRKYRILGGVYRVDLLDQPPQPKDLGKDSRLTTLQLPKEPRFAPYFRPHRPAEPLPDAERTPEAIEAEAKALEAAMEALVLLVLRLPETVLWFEPPLVAHWLPEKRIWSTEHVHDLKFSEEKRTISFRSGRLGVHGLAAYRYANLPFQSWELKPEPGRAGAEREAGVVLGLAAATVQAEFLVRGGLVRLTSFSGASSAPLQGILSEPMELESLIERLQQVGCDLFPDRDAASYLKGLPVKHPVAEKHLRECMALLSTAYSFSWSRWNATRGFREIVLLFKEVHGCVAKQRANLTLLVTPLRTMRVRCTEVSPEFSAEPLEDEDEEFYADLYHLALNTAGIKSRLLMDRMPFQLFATVARLLERTNVIGASS